MSASEAKEQAVSEPIRQLIELFSKHLPEVAFPDVTAQGLQDHARMLEERARALATAEETVALARREHAEARSALQTMAERGLGYARVYAADDEELLGRLEAIEFRPRPRRKPPAKRKARRSRAPSNVAELPLGDKNAAR